ncbi:hypothetical protein ACN20G_00090 [Streptomyces sp. BI20]|uniref:hypothetical protein n=1 Tax=Streptomyces sp. BI20 TaxID=3403460 RepID=UPI003C710D26
MTTDPFARIALIRTELTALGLTQPQYWILRHLAPNDLGSNTSARRLDELTDALEEYLLPGDDLLSDATDLMTRALITRTPDGRLRITPAGQAAHTRVKDNIPAIKARLEAASPS